MSEPIKKKQTEYSDAQFADNYPEGMENNHWIYARSLFVRRILRRCLPAGTNILEIGCGAGIVLDFLACSGFSCRGVELGTPRLVPSVKPLAWTGVGFHELDGEYRNSVKTVLLLDVIEHIQDPSKFLRDVGSSFSNLETVVITVPARQELWSNYDEYFGHYRRYGPEGLSNFLIENDFEVEDIGYFFHSLYIPMLVFNKLGLKRRLKNSRPKGVWLHRIASYWHFMESCVLPRSMIGGSLYAIAKRRSCKICE